MAESNLFDKFRLSAIISKHYPNATIVKVEDYSSGCDNWIFAVTLSSAITEPIIVRIPRKLSEPDCPVMHWPRFQALILTILTNNDIPVPKLLHESSDYLIESYLRETNLTQVMFNDDKQKKEILSKMGYYVKRLHSIDCCQRFGYIVDFDSDSQKLIGKYDNWKKMFDQELPDNLIACHTSGLIDEHTFDKLNRLFDRVKPYLSNYCTPKLLHSDICANNTRVSYNRQLGYYQFNGLVDWADAMCGDPMFDLGELLLSYFGDQSVIEMFECGYGKVSEVESRMIVFYAIHYNIWLLNSSLEGDQRDKYTDTLARLTTMIIM